MRRGCFVPRFDAGPHDVCVERSGARLAPLETHQRGLAYRGSLWPTRKLRIQCNESRSSMASFLRHSIIEHQQFERRRDQWEH